MSSKPTTPPPRLARRGAEKRSQCCITTPRCPHTPANNAMPSAPYGAPWQLYGACAGGSNRRGGAPPRRVEAPTKLDVLRNPPRGGLRKTLRFVQLPRWLVIRGRVGKLGYSTQRRRANRYSNAPGAKRPFRDTECITSLRLALHILLYVWIMNYSCFLCERSVKTSASA